MTADVVRARMDSALKKEAAAVLAEMGLSLSDAIRLLLVRVATEKALPFDVRVPNAGTQAAMREARSGKVSRFDGVGDLMADLNEADRVLSGAGKGSAKARVRRPKPPAAARKKPSKGTRSSSTG